MKTFRKIIFWTHLVTGLIAGLAIAIMSITGVLLAFETEIVEWAERDARSVSVPDDAKALSLSDLQAKLREHVGAASAAIPAGRGDPIAAEAAATAAKPVDPRSFAVTMRNDPSAAIAFSAGREGGYYANPYTGELRQPASTAVHDFMHVLLDWHRFLGREGESRPIGKLINGICNLAFCALAITGLYIWMPRNWSWRSVRAIALFNWQYAGKARDFNWHNVIGLWSAPVLIVLTLTAVPISFRWGGNLIYRLVGEAPPLQAGLPGAGVPAVEITRPSPDAGLLGYDVIVANVQQEFPRWEQISLRSGALQRAGARPPANANAGGPPQPGADTGRAAGGNTRPSSEAPAPAPASREARGGEARGPQPITVTIRESGSWPRTATTTLTANPFTGDVLKREGHNDLSAAARIRRWTRFLHTGEALGWGGQLVAGLASLGGVFLVYTGFALSWRRFAGKREPPVIVPGATAAGSDQATAPSVASAR